MGPGPRHLRRAAGRLPVREAQAASGRGPAGAFAVGFLCRPGGAGADGGAGQGAACRQGGDPGPGDGLSERSGLRGHARQLRRRPRLRGSAGRRPGSDHQGPEAATQFPFIAGLTPDFTQHFDYRYGVGTMPFMGGKEPRLGGWIKLREAAPRGAGVAELLALLDAWPPAVFTLLKGPAAGSSLTWTVDFVQVPEDCTAGDWWQYQAEIRHSANGYSHIDAWLWDQHGRMALSSRQTVSVFA
ncbi:thioesterase family protein [Pseudomonas sp. LPB0260]|nr:thioesterase family protein [Pseudomonas sp. LPB0260]QLC75939.1 thioesterase family protein [Pseudomonas sp. LPB0260]